MYVGASVPTVRERGGIRSGPATSIAIASGYASRVHYFWAGAGYEKRLARGGDQWVTSGTYSLVYGYRPPPLQLDYPKPDLRFFVEARVRRTAGCGRAANAIQQRRADPAGGADNAAALQTIRARRRHPVSRPSAPERQSSRANTIASSSMPATFSGFVSPEDYMRRFSAALLALLLVAPATARAELRHVQLNVLGMD